MARVISLVVGDGSGVDTGTWTDSFTDNGDGTWTSAAPTDNGDGTWTR